MTNARWVDEPTFVGDRRQDGDQMAIVLVRCAPPNEILDDAAMSALTPPPHAALLSWDAFWAGDERYMLRGQRWDGGVEWYAVRLVSTASEPTARVARQDGRTERGGDAARARTMLVGWRPFRSGTAARWTVAWRRS